MKRAETFGETMGAVMDLCAQTFPWLFFGGTLLILLINAATN